MIVPAALFLAFAFAAYRTTRESRRLERLSYAWLAFTMAFGAGYLLLRLIPGVRH